MNAKRGRPTIRQVAALAGVSHQTVSRYLRANGGLRPETEKRVAAAIGELDYRPDLLARSMRTRRSGILAIVVPGLSVLAAPPWNSLRAACAEAGEAGYRVEIVFGHRDTDDLSARARELLHSGQVEGVLAFTPVFGTEAEVGGPVLQAGEFDENLRATGAVADDLETMADLVGRLAAMGHEHFLHVAGPSDWFSAEQRRTGYRQAVAELDLTSHGIINGPWDPTAGAAAVRALDEDSPVTALVGASDGIAIGMMRASLERGWAVPGRVSITGWDDVPASGWSTPSLSTVEVDRHTAARHAMRRLLAIVRAEPEPEAPDVTLTRIVLRESTGPPSGHGQ